MIRRTIIFMLAALALTAGAAQAATTDTANATAPATARVGELVTFSQAVPCTQTCRLTWTWQTGTRLGQRIGDTYAQSIQFAFPRAGLQKVTLDLSQPCVGSGGRLICHSYSFVTVDVTE